MWKGGGEGVHVGFSDEFDGDGDVEFPGTEGFIVGGGNETTIFIDERDGVDGLQMVVVFLRHSPSAGIILHDFLVRHARQELVQVVGVGFDNVRDARSANAGGTRAGFGVPEFDVAVVGCAEEVLTGGLEGEVGDAFGVAGVGTKELAVAVDVEDFDFGVVAAGEEEVGGGGEEADDGNGFGAVVPGVDELFGVEAALGGVVVVVGGGMHVGATLVVGEGVAVE